MAGSDEEKAGWVSRVLGVSVSGAASGAPPGAVPGATAGEAAPGYSPVAVGKAALEWRSLCAAGGAELAKLKGAIIAAYSEEDWDEDEVADVVGKVDELDAVLTRLDGDLADTVDAFLNAAPGPVKDASLQAVLDEIADHEELIRNDELLADVDSNEFLSTGLQARALKALAALRGGFEKAA